MKQYAQTIDLKDDPELIRGYIEHHKNVWQEVEQGLRGVGIRRMLIYLLGRRLFMFLETDDNFEPARDFARFEASSEKIREWQRLMEMYQEQVAEAGKGEWWTQMKLVYSLEGSGRR